MRTRISMAGALTGIELQNRGGRGQRGYDAYEVAKAQGFPGSRDEWLESLVGRLAPEELASIAEAQRQAGASLAAADVTQQIATQRAADAEQAAGAAAARAGEAVQARDLAQAAQLEAEQAAAAAQPYASRAQASTAIVPTPLLYISIDGLLYRRDATGTALTTGDGVTWSPVGDITPFHFGDGAAGWQVEINAAIAYAVTTGRMRVAIPAGIRKRISLTAPFTSVSGIEVYGIGNPEIEVASSTVFSQPALDGFKLRDVTIIGPYSGTAYLMQLGPGCRRCEIDVTFVGTNSGIVVTDAPDNTIAVRGRNVRGTLAKITGSGSVRNRVKEITAENVSGFGLLLEAGACDNQVDVIRKFVNLPDLPEAQKAGTQWDAATGRLGLEALGITVGCNRNRIGSVAVVQTHDNGVSITGDYNTVEDITAENCDHEGVHFYGSNNVVGFLRARANRMSGAGAGGSETAGAGTNNTILNGVAIENGYYAARFSAPSDHNDIRVRSIGNALGDSYSAPGSGSNNSFNAYPNALNTAYQKVAGSLGAVVQTVTSSSYAPQISQVRQYDGGADVVSGSLLGRWDVFGWLAGAAQQAFRLSVHASSIANDILRAKLRLNVVNADGTLRPAAVLDMQGRIGIARTTATDEFAPLAELDNDGVTRLSSLTLKASVLTGYAGAPVDVSYASALHISAVTGGASLGALTTSAAGNQLLIIKNMTSQPLTIPHSSTGIRTASGRDVVLGAFKAILLEQASGAVWDEVRFADGTPQFTSAVVAGALYSGSLSGQNREYNAYDGAAIDATGRVMLSIAPAATGTILGALSSSDAGYQIVVIRNTSSNTLTVPHATNGYRLNGKASLVLGAHESVTLIHVSGTVWQQI